jgi:glutamate-1-semialdehyde 2,1-aminomutase
MLIKSGSGLAGEPEASSKGIADGTKGDTIVCELGDIASVEKAFELYKDDIAGIFIEPLPANNGLLIQDKEFIQALRDITKKHNSLLIFDEVISGFRVCFKGMTHDLGIIPDIVTYGKIIGGGFPVGAVASRKEIMEKLAPVGDVYQAGTLSANPVAMAAGLANLKQLNCQFYKDLTEKSNKIVETFNNYFQNSEFNDYKMVQYKSLFWTLPTDKRVMTPGQIPENLNERFFKLFKTLLDKGIYLSPNAYEVGFCSSAHDDKAVEELKKLLWS